MGVKVLVGTDRSPSADVAASWAADMARRYDAELVLVQVLPAEETPVDDREVCEPERVTEARASLLESSQQLAGARGHATVILGDDPAADLVRAAEHEHADVVVVGNVGMADRKRFLLGNVPNRVSHLARCTVVIVNSAGAVTNDRSAEHVLAPAPLLTPRAVHIGRVVARIVLAEVRARCRGGRNGPSETERARLLRDQLEELGPTFSKLGQLLSTRPDLIPAAYVEELASLQDKVHPMDEAAVVAVMERELGVPWEDVFETIDASPLAAGTIAQVHRATLASGERVVVKVQRPEAEDIIGRDLSLLTAFAGRLAAHPAISKLFDVPAVVEELSTTISQELDFEHEARNLERMRTVLSAYDRLGVPGLFPELSSRRLLVMQEIPGVPISQAPSGGARQDAARQLVESYYRQVLTEGFFHADPHPGNLLWWDDKVWFLDLGMAGELDSRTRADLLLLLLAFWRKDAEFLAELAVSLAGKEAPPDLDLAAFQAELAALMEQNRDLPLEALQLGALLQDMTKISFRYGVALPSALVLTAKALAQIQLAATSLDTTLDPFAVAGSFVARSSLDAARDTMDPRQLLYEARKFAARTQRALEALERLTGSRPGPGLQVQVRGIDTIRADLRLVGRWLALALTAAGALVATAIAATSSSTSSAALWFFAAVASVLVVWLTLSVLRNRVPEGR